MIFIAMYVVSYVGGGLLLRYAEGATYLAVVQVSASLTLRPLQVPNPQNMSNFFWEKNILVSETVLLYIDHMTSM